MPGMLPRSPVAEDHPHIRADHFDALKKDAATQTLRAWTSHERQGARKSMSTWVTRRQDSKMDTKKQNSNGRWPRVDRMKKHRRRSKRVDFATATVACVPAAIISRYRAVLDRDPSSSFICSDIVENLGLRAVPLYDATDQTGGTLSSLTNIPLYFWTVAQKTLWEQPSTNILALSVFGFGALLGLIYFRHRKHKYQDPVLVLTSTTGVAVGFLLLGLDAQGVLLCVLPWCAIGAMAVSSQVDRD
ncbi:hypothetical protein QBC46DRAFT_118401 [Diplogelasinospora grovesii]|uniref:Uncharacterized protein n=1 Tax=Diplogelasinospora grovesii TaxID=303347 RepID=A0AAN6N8W7_9PEZI|nr:hypothetical protein QBC46DRAFT_118401 [Diplogelasinospora grovesii]